MGGGGPSAQVKPDATPPTDIHHPAPSSASRPRRASINTSSPCEKNCPVCGASNFIEPGQTSVRCFKCKREGKVTEVTREGAQVMDDPSAGDQKLVAKLHANVQTHEAHHIY